MSSELDKKLEELEKQSQEVSIIKLNKKLYGCKLKDYHLMDLPQSKLMYLHVKIHNALSYKKPFAKFEDLKLMHDLIIGYMDKHHRVDELDD